MYSQAALLEKSKRFDEACNAGLFKGYKCCVLGAECAASVLVTVPAHPGYEENTRNVDLYVDEYLHPNPQRSPAVEKLDELGICLRSFPASLKRKEQHHWTIFLPYHEKDTGISEPRNKVYDSLKCRDAKNSVKGNIVVVKATNKGAVCDVTERDVAHIEWLVYHYLEQTADHDSLHQYAYPILKPEECFSALRNPDADATNNIFIPELLQEIAVHLPWSALGYLSDFPDPGLCVVKRELRRRILHHLARFVPKQHVEDFWTHLENAGAVITGSFVRCVLQEGELPSHSYFGAVSNLNIVVPRYQDDGISTALLDYGFVRWEGSVAEAFKSVCHSHARFYRGDDEEDTVPSITLTAAQRGVIEVILASPTTADMTFITATELVSLFPRLLHQYEALAVEKTYDVSEAITKVQGQGMRILQSNENWTKPCDVFCPMRLRKTYGDAGFTRMQWHDTRFTRPPRKTAWFDRKGQKDDDQDSLWVMDREKDIMYLVNLRWRIWSVCLNPHCGNSIKYIQRARYLKP